MRERERRSNVGGGCRRYGGETMSVERERSHGGGIEERMVMKREGGTGSRQEKVEEKENV